MGVEIKLPDLGEGIDSCDILEVLVSEGDTVARDQNIVEIETDKATVEVPTTHAGTVTKIHVSSGDSVGVGQTLITLETVAAATPSAAAAPAPTESAAPRPAADEAPPAPAASAPAPTPAPAAAVSAPTPPAQPSTNPSIPSDAASSVTVAQADSTIANPNRPIPAGPAMRRFAREVGVDLAQVIGTGANGRITREDVLQVVRQPNQSPPPSSPPPSSPPEAPAAASAASDITPTEDVPPAAGVVATDAWGPIDIEKASKMRRTIAAKMFESWSTVPRVTNFDDADVTALEAVRQSSKLDYAAKGIKLTSMPFLIKAVSMALRQNPTINASLDVENDQIIYKRYVNVGIAVDTDRGLVVPALRNTDQLSISEIAKDLATMAENIRSNNFSLDDLRGGTFTISNLGAIGGTYSTPIINVPEVAILLVGRSRKMPVVMDDEVKVRLLMPLSLSYDHRLVDGAAAARFLNDVIGYLEGPSRLLLAP